MTDRPHLLTPREAAQMLGVSYPTIKQWILAGKIKTIKTPGGHHRLAPESVKSYMAGRGGQPETAALDGPRMPGVNELPGEVVSVRIEGLLAEVVVRVGGLLVTSIITAEDVSELGIAEGRSVAALVRPSSVMIKTGG